MINIFSRKERKNPLFVTIYLLLFLLIGKTFLCVLLYPRRIAPAYPLPFLLMASILGSSFFSDPARLKGSITKFLKNSLIFLSLIILIYISYAPDLLKRSLNLIFSPTYNTLSEFKQVDPILDRRYKAIFLDGRFAYIAVQSPMKFIDIPPNIDLKDFFQVETNPPLVRKRIYQDPDIGYVFFRPDNKVIQRMLEDEFGAKLIASNVSRYGLLYKLPPRNKPFKK